MKKIAVLMTCFNRAETTLACLRSLFAQQMPDGYAFDVWLVDDASPDKTGERVAKEFPQVNIVQGTGQLFWCRGMRKAWDCAATANNYDFYLWLNDDVVLADDALKTVLSDYNVLENRPLRVITGAFYDSAEKRNIVYCSFQANVTQLIPNGRFPQEGRYWFGGNLVLISREVFEVAGPIDSKFHHGYGDGDYAKRLTKLRIPFFVPSRVLGVCPLENIPFRSLRTIPFFKRVRLLWQPNGFHLGDAVRFSYRHKGGIFRAVLTGVHVCCTVVFGIGRIRK